MEEDLRALVVENLRLTQEMHEKVEKMQRYLFWQRVMSIVYFVVLFAPLVLAAIYLPPLIQDMLMQYQSVLQSL